MLETIAGVAVVTKLRAILLMEADFNFHNKLILGKRMMDLACRHGMVPEEIYSKKERTAEDAVLHQVLAYDIARQKRTPLKMALVDAAQCYNRTAHGIAALSMRAAKVPENSIYCMLKPIQEMEFFICTTFGEFSTPVGRKHNLKQGACQGNGAAPPMWQQISTTMLRAQHKAGHGITVTTLISKESCTMAAVAGILYVDDTNLWAGMEEEEDLDKAVYKAQVSVAFWGRSLIATGGALNPGKCKWSIHELVPKEDGTWEYRRCKPQLLAVNKN